MKNYVNVVKDHLFEMAFVSLLVRVLVLGASLNEALIIISLLGTLAYVKHFLTKSKNDKDSLSEQEIKDIKSAVSALQFSAGIKRSINEPKK